MIEILLQDLLKIKRCLNTYYTTCIKNDSGLKKQLTEAEIFCKEEIVNDLQSLLDRLSIDIQTFSQSVCKSNKQKIEENKNLIDLTREAKYVLLRLRRFGQFDEKIQNIFLQLKNKIETFKIVLKQYVEKSSFKILNWEAAQLEAKKEENELENF